MKPKQPSGERHDLDSLLSDWPYAVGEVSARQTRGIDGRAVLQLRVDLGVLQMEVEGRPDGTRPEGFDTYFDLLLTMVEREGEAFELNPHRCNEIDREFVQFYHRRVARLALRHFDQAVADADHTLALMDFSTAHAPSEDWVEMHEQYRPFVLFHRTQAAALSALEQSDAEAAILAIDAGLKALERSLESLADETDEEAFEEQEDEFVDKLHELRRSILEEYEVEASLGEQLAEAIAREQYELAAELRDRIAHRRKQSRAPRG